MKARLAAAAALLAAVVGYGSIAPLGAGPQRSGEKSPVHEPLQNGVPWPATFRPYGPQSFWNLPVPDTKKPKLLDRSDEIVALVERNDPGPWIHTVEAGAGWDEGHPVVIARAGDPLVGVRCTKYCELPYPKQIHIPAKARPGSGGDAHLAIVQPDGTEIDTWAQRDNAMQAGDWANGSTLTAANVVDCGNFYSGLGRTRAPGASTVGGACLAGGIIHYNELMAGTIRHAIFLGIVCAAPRTHVFPAVQDGDESCTGPGPHAPIGAHVWLDMPDSRIDALAIQGWEKTILRAMHRYGGYLMDTGCQAPNCPPYGDSFVNLMLAQETDVQYAAFGAPSPWAAFAASHGWSGLPIRPKDLGYRPAIRWVFADHWNPLAAAGGWNSGHLHLLDPCYAKRSC